MIELNVDLSFLSKYFELTTSRMSNYTNKTVEEMMKEEERNGNPVAFQYASLMQKPERVAEFLRLEDPINRYLIIRHMSAEDLRKILPYLKKEDLIWGLKYFTKDKLVELMEQLPKKELLKVVFQNFQLDDILKLMPRDEINDFLQNDKIEKPDVMKFFKQLEYKDLERLFKEYFGAEFAENQDKEASRKMMIQTIEALDPQDFKKMIMEMRDEDKCLLIMNLVENKPQLMLEFENKSIARPMMLLDKVDMLKSLKVLEDEFIIKMVEQLPDDLLQVIATQIDPQMFAQLLIDEFPDVLSQISF